MNRCLALMFGLLAAGVIRPAFSAEADAAAKFAPESYQVSRYQHIWKRSPFIVESVTTVQSPGLATKYALVGLAQSDSDPMVFLVDRNEPDPAKNRLIVSLKNPNHNVELVSISPAVDIHKSTAMIRQGSEQATLPFDSSVLAPSGPGAQTGSILPVPPPPTGLPGTSPNFTPRPPSAYIPPPVQSGGIVPAQPVIPPPPTNGQANLNQQPGLTPPASAAGLQTPPTPTRRIIRPKPINVNP